jgi:carboxyl-terminal processing protease
MNKDNHQKGEVIMKRKHFLLIVISVVVISLFFGGVIGTYLGAQVTDDTQAITQKIKLFMKIIRTTEKNYFQRVEPTELLDYAIRGMLRALDPHTIYLDSEDYNELMVGTKGSFGGLGIQIGLREDVLTIITPIEGTPASRCGLLSGDKIVEIEGVSTEGIRLQDAVKKLRGKPGSEVTIGIKREGIEEITHFTITRDIIKVTAVPYSTMVNHNIAYVRLSTFSESSTDEFKNAVDSLKQEGAKKYIIDLRNNSGGLLKAAINISDIFLEKGKLIVYTKGRKIGTSREYYARVNLAYEDIPVVILVNRGSASASEIVSGAIQDWDRGIIVGTKTYGKGSVQQVIPLDNENALKITTALYYSPSGRSIDTEVKDNRYRRSLGIETNDEKDTTTYYTKRLERKVYGGGAITPDIEITTPSISKLETKIYQKGVFLSFAVFYTLDHKLSQGFSVDSEMLNEFKKHLREKEIEFTQKEFEEALPGIKTGLKRNISLKLWGIKSSYEATLKDDIQIQKAIQILKNSKNVDDLFAYISENKEE